MDSHVADGGYLYIDIRNWDKILKERSRFYLYDPFFVDGDPYLEKVCHINLKKLASVLQEMKRYAAKNNLKPSYTFYKQWGRKNKSTKQLRFSKTGNEYMEKLYATHYVKNKAECGE